MKTKYSILCLCIIICYWVKFSTSEMTQQNIDSKESFKIILNDIDRFPPSKQKRNPSSKNTQSKSKSATRTKPDISTNEVLEGLPTGVSYMSDIKSVAIKDYESSLGEVVAKNNRAIFFKYHSTDDRFANVVYDQSRKSFFPISSVLQVKGVDENTRQEILANGFEEYYYREDLKIIYLQSSHSQIISAYQDLVSKGHDVSLEIQRAFNQKR